MSLKINSLLASSVFVLGACLTPAIAVESEATYSSLQEHFYGETGKYAPETESEAELYAALEELYPQSERATHQSAMCGEHAFDLTPLTADDVLVIGDSQLWEGVRSWSAAGITQAGYRTDRRICSAGGIGFLSKNDSSGSYFDGVVGGQWKLPAGKPAAIFIIGSGNDANHNHVIALGQAKEVVDKLRQTYPGVRIIMTDPISSRGSAKGINNISANRLSWGKKLMDFAAKNGITFISTRYWASDYRLSTEPGSLKTYYLDAVHFNLAGHQKLAPYFRNSFQQAMKGYTLKGGIGNYLADQGGTERFGVPISNEFTLVHGGSGQQFSNNYTIYWNRQNEVTSAVNFNTGIGSKYRADGFENTYGYPLWEEARIAHGGMQKFSVDHGRHTYALYWADAWRRTHAVKEFGAIGARFTHEGGTEKYGFPNADEQSFADGALQTFYNFSTRKNYSIYWSPNTDAKVMIGGGAIHVKWLSQGGTKSLGYPVTDEIAESGAIVQYFRNSKGEETGIWWHPKYGTHSMNSKGAIYWHWRSAGGYGTLGYPTSDEIKHADGSATVSFSSGRILRWTASGGVVEVAQN